MRNQKGRRVGYCWPIGCRRRASSSQRRRNCRASSLTDKVGESRLSKLRIPNFAISMDGYGAGPNQDTENPLGLGGLALHEWLIATRTFGKLYGDGDGTTGAGDEFAARGFDSIGAWILGRNMFGPVRGPWPNDQWKGWWGDDPPYHTPVFVLTSHARAPITMDGGTTFHLSYGWHPCRTPTGDLRRQGAGHPIGRRSRHDPSIPPGGARGTKCTSPLRQLS